MMTYDEAIKELYWMLYGNNPTNFHADLYRLISRADPNNRARLRVAYPMEVRVWEEYQASKTPAEFFRRIDFQVP